MKPIFAVLLLQGKFFSLKQMDEILKHKLNYRCYPDMHVFWAKKRNLLKEKDFISSLENFDVKKVKP